MLYKGQYVEGYMEFFKGKETPKYMRGTIVDIQIEGGEVCVDIRCNDKYNGYRYVTFEACNIEYPIKSLKVKFDEDVAWYKDDALLNQNKKAALNYTAELALRRLLNLEIGRFVSFKDIVEYDKASAFEPYIIDNLEANIKYANEESAFISYRYKIVEVGKFLVFVREK